MKPKRARHGLVRLADQDLGSDERSLFLGRLDADALRRELDEAGILAGLERRGYRDVGFELSRDENEHRLLVRASDAGEEPLPPLIELRCAEETLLARDLEPRPDGFEVLSVLGIRWLALQDPRARFAPFFIVFRAREDIYELLDACCGARLTVSYVRIGGLAADVPDEFEARCRKALASIREVTLQAEKLLTRNPIFANRFRDIGVLSADDALSYGWVGPCLRGSGVAYDIRKDHPYSGYEQYDFDVPIGTIGDCYDRYLVRIEEIYQSVRIIEQALAKLPKGPVITDDKRVALPPKSEVYSNIEALMNHFKLVYEGILPPAGEVYGYSEAANGELGFYIVSDGGKCPWRVKVRPPCFNIYQAYPEMIKGGFLADAVAIIGGLNVVAGELDR